VNTTPPVSRYEEIRQDPTTKGKLHAVLVNRTQHKERYMIVKRFASIILILFYFIFGCASKTVVHEPPHALPWKIMPTKGDFKVKHQHIQDITRMLISYHRVLLNTKTYHPESNLDNLATEVNKYIYMYVNPIINETYEKDTVEINVLVAKLHFVVISLYSNLDNKKQVKEYLQLFHKRYGNYKDFSDLTLDSIDIGYSTLGAGIKELEQRVNFVYNPWAP
jgi:hypothetical protein